MTRAVCAPAAIGETVAECVGRLLSVLGEAGIAWEPLARVEREAMRALIRLGE
ncbi:hypothetical protein [Streptomyces echinatus]|uniref:Uncharacterized protein n=1 Tax=Streptomyces echinatus TaxID=67293 RepID=A0A7W9UPV1_9ACTN|nr:hypothetical protein [Streptomyces echinatus]MBB5926745.1 hypothetical protein [Streptomyces echinatus]